MPLEQLLDEGQYRGRGQRVRPFIRVLIQGCDPQARRVPTQERGEQVEHRDAVGGPEGLQEHADVPERVVVAELYQDREYDHAHHRPACDGVVPDGEQVVLRGAPFRGLMLVAEVRVADRPGIGTGDAGPIDAVLENAVQVDEAIEARGGVARHDLGSHRPEEALADRCTRPVAQEKHEDHDVWSEAGPDAIPELDPRVRQAPGQAAVENLYPPHAGQGDGLVQSMLDDPREHGRFVGNPPAVGERVTKHHHAAVLRRLRGLIAPVAQSVFVGGKPRPTGRALHLEEHVVPGRAITRARDHLHDTERNDHAHKSEEGGGERTRPGRHDVGRRRALDPRTRPRRLGSRPGARCR